MRAARVGGLSAAAPAAVAAFALVAPAADVEDVSWVVVDVQGSALGAGPEAIGRALEGHVGDLGYEVRITDNDAPLALGPGDLLVTLHAEPDDAWRVEFRREEDAPWSRQLPPDTDLDLRLEGLGVIVRGVLMEGDVASAGVASAVEDDAPDNVSDRAPDPAPDPTHPPASTRPTPEPDRHAQHGFRVSLAYRADSFVQRPRHGALLGVGWQHPRGPTLELAGGWAPPQEAGPLSIQRIPLQIAAGWRFRRQAVVQPAALAGGSVEALGWERAPAGTRAAPGWTTRVSAFLGAEAVVTLGRGVFAFARVAGHVWVQSASLLQRDATGEDAALVAPSRLSGAGLLGVGWRVGVGAP